MKNDVWILLFSVFLLGELIILPFQIWQREKEIDELQDQIVVINDRISNAEEKIVELKKDIAKCWKAGETPSVGISVSE